MRRIISVLAVVALMAAMLVTFAAPAFAQGNHEGLNKCQYGQHRAHGNFDSNDDRYWKHRLREDACDEGVPPGGITGE